MYGRLLWLSCEYACQRTLQSSLEICGWYGPVGDKASHNKGHYWTLLDNKLKLCICSLLIGHESWNLMRLYGLQRWSAVCPTTSRVHSREGRLAEMEQSVECEKPTWVCWRCAHHVPHSQGKHGICISTRCHTIHQRMHLH